MAHGVLMTLNGPNGMVRQYYHSNLVYHSSALENICSLDVIAEGGERKTEAQFPSSRGPGSGFVDTEGIFSA